MVIAGTVITSNPVTSRYEKTVDGHTVFAEYRDQGGVVYILHVEAAPALRGSGAASAFMQELVTKLHSEGKDKIVPVCSYAAHWMARQKP